ncbi:MAG: hypothetical protein QM755_04735 [Luteolibacter sp.]
MKRSFILLCSSLLLGAALASAQNAPPMPVPPESPIVVQPPPVANPGTPSVRQRRLPPAGGSLNNENPTPANELDRNRSLRLEGNLGDHRNIKLTVTGLGPQFQSDSMIEDGSLVTLNYVINDSGKGPVLDYSIGVRIAVPVGTSIEYRSLVFKSRALCQPGKPLEIYRNDKQSLTLTLDPTAEGDKAEKN